MLAVRALPLASLLALAAPALAQDGAPAEGAAIPARPEQIEFPTLDFQPPDPAAMRRVLPSGVVVYVAPSKELPLVDVSFVFKGGSYLDPVGKEGLAGATVSMLRRGGTKSLDAAAFDERLDMLAIELGAGASEYHTSVSMNTLTKNLHQALGLMVEMVREPRFQADRLRLYKDEVTEALKQRNDDAGDILDREWTAILYGRDHFKARDVTKASLDGLSEDDLRGHLRRVLHPKNLVVGVSGDFEVEVMLEKLEQAFTGWEAGAVPADPPAPTHALAPGVYYVEKDIPQGKVVLGLRGIQRDDPDFFALQVMSQILGSGGFTSRITNRVRSEEGLAYSAGAYVAPGLYFPGEFRAFFQSKSRTVALATKIIMEEVARIRAEPVGDDELSTAKSALVEAFPNTFSSKAAAVTVYVNDEVTGRGFEYWKTYRDKVRAVTAADVQRVAKQHLDPSKMAVLVVGKWEDIAPGDLGGRAKMAELFQGQAKALPLRDPLTLEPLR